jgi:hypothetical protein
MHILKQAAKIGLNLTRGPKIVVLKLRLECFNEGSAGSHVNCYTCMALLATKKTVKLVIYHPPKAFPLHRSHVQAKVNSTNSVISLESG